MVMSLAKWLGTLATVVGVVFVAFQYFDGKWKSRIERSLDYINQYQSSHLVAVRNIIDLRTASDQDYYLRYERDQDGDGLSEKDEQQGVPMTITSMEPAEGVDEALETFKREYQRGDKYLPNLSVNTSEGKRKSAQDYLESKCEWSIETFAKSRLSLDSATMWKFKDQEWKMIGRIESIDDEDPKIDTKILFDDGRELTRYQNGELWWSESKNSTSYEYAFPELVYKFFNQNFYVLQNDKLTQEQIELKKRWNECSVALSSYEALLENYSDQLVESLHEVKHFYAALSICATAGLCDSFVACEAFDLEVGAFLRDWQHYFELWGPRERRTEYERLHKFVVHCRSNSQFRDRLGKPPSGMLYVQQFTNYCWAWRGQGDGFCGLLQYAADAVAGLGMEEGSFEAY